MPDLLHETATATDALDAALSPGGLRPVFQPIVDLRDGTAVAYEALARGVPGAALERPDQLFAAARAQGRLVELDWACRVAALEVAAGLEATLFVNAEPDALGPDGPHALRERRVAAAAGRDVVVELTERALTARPAELLRTVERLREAGLGIAVDDVGADIRSLALLPLLAPDVVKLDLRLVQQHPTREIAAIVNAVRAHRERTGAHVVAEGIETAAQHETAIALGATLGQGWHFGRPGPLPVAARDAVAQASARADLPVAGTMGAGGADALTQVAGPAGGVARIARRQLAAGATPFEVVAPHRPVERSTKPLLIAMSLQLEDEAAALGRDVVVLSAFQTAERFTPATARRYEALAAKAAFVAAFGVELSAVPVPGVRGARLASDDALSGEWSVVVIGHHFAAALVARDLGDRGPEAQRRFDFAVTYDRELAVAAAATLMRRIEPLA